MARRSTKSTFDTVPVGAEELAQRLLDKCANGAALIQATCGFGGPKDVSALTRLLGLFAVRLAFDDDAHLQRAVADFLDRHPDTSMRTLLAYILHFKNQSSKRRKSPLMAPVEQYAAFLFGEALRTQREFVVKWKAENVTLEKLPAAFFMVFGHDFSLERRPF
jgi:hypothetical protein